MNIKFHSDKISLKSIDLKEASKMKPQAVRSLSEIMDDIKNKQALAASAAKEVKTASVDAPAPKVAAAPAVQIKVADDLLGGVDEIEQAADVAAAPAAPAPGAPVDPLAAKPMAPMAPKPMAAAPMAPAAPKPMVPPPAPMGAGKPVPPAPGVAPAPMAKNPGLPAVKPVPPVGTQAPAPAMAAAKGTLKIAKELDFRGWEAEKVASAWGEYGTSEKCEATVAGKTSDPKKYCELIRVAANVATVKIASAKKEEKVASPAFQKIAKLPAAQLAWLKEYYSKYYGEKFVAALLGDY